MLELSQYTVFIMSCIVKSFILGQRSTNLSVLLQLNEKCKFETERWVKGHYAYVFQISEQKVNLIQ